MARAHRLSHSRVRKRSQAGLTHSVLKPAVGAVLHALRSCYILTAQGGSSTTAFASRARGLLCRLTQCSVFVVARQRQEQLPLQTSDARARDRARAHVHSRNRVHGSDFRGAHLLVLVLGCPRLRCHLCSQANSVQDLA